MAYFQTGLLLLLCHVFLARLSLVDSEVLQRQRRDTVKADCKSALGLSNYKIPDQRLKAYSYARSGFKRWYPYNARLYHIRGWCSSSNIVGKEYVEVDLGRVRHVTSIASQGVVHLGINYYVREYKLKYSFDGDQWYEYQGGKELQGNRNGNDLQTNYLGSSFVARYVRVYPTSYRRDMCMRLELYGCPDDTDCTTLITATQDPQNITSPGYPAGYALNMHCTWILAATPTVSDGIVSVYFPELDVGAHDTRWCSDKVRVLDGISHDSKSLGTFCNGPGGGRDSASVMTSSGKYLRVDLDSDWSASGSRGFTMVYSVTTDGVNDVLSEIRCGDSQITLNCSQYEHTIALRDVFYGAYPGTSCSVTSPTTSGTCQLPVAREVVRNRCQDREVCTLTFEDHTLLHAQLCLNSDGLKVTPILKVLYQCTSLNRINDSMSPPTQMPSAEPTLGVESLSGAYLAPTEESAHDLYIIIIAALALLVVLVVALLVVFVLFKRRKRTKNDHQQVSYHAARPGEEEYEDVGYETPSVTVPRPPDSRTMNHYEGDNPLYESIDISKFPIKKENPLFKELSKPAKAAKCDSKIYDSCPNLTRITDNPIYESPAASASCSRLSGDANLYDNVHSQPKNDKGKTSHRVSLPSLENPSNCSLKI